MSSLGGIGSQQPWPPYTPPTFSQIDSNADGGISLDELEAAGPQGSSASDGSASATQQAKAQSLFSQIDSNGDGSISNAEFSAFQTQAQGFAAQLIANGQQPPDAAGGSPPAGGSGHVHGGGHHHHAASTSADPTDSTDATDGSSDGTGDSLLSTLENIVDASAPTDDPGQGAATDGTPGSLFSSAINAYSNGSSTDTWSSLSNLLQQAA
jgi:hypothetical protein